MEVYQDAAAMPGFSEPDGEEFDFDSFSELVSSLESPDSSPSTVGATATRPRDQLAAFKRTVLESNFGDVSGAALHTFEGVQLCIGSNPLRNGELMLVDNSVVWSQQMSAGRSAGRVLSNSSKRNNRRQSFDLVTIKEFDKLASEEESKQQRLVYEFPFERITNLEAQNFGPVVQVILDNDIIFELEFLSADGADHINFAKAYDGIVSSAIDAEPQTSDAIAATVEEPAFSPAASAQVTPAKAKEDTEATSPSGAATPSAPATSTASSFHSAETPQVVRHPEVQTSSPGVPSPVVASPVGASTAHASPPQAEFQTRHSQADDMIKALRKNLLAQISSPAGGCDDWQNDIRRFVAVSNGSPSLSKVLHDRIISHPMTAQYPLPVAATENQTLTSQQRKKQQRKLVRSLLPAVDVMTKAREVEAAKVAEHTSAFWKKSRAGRFTYFDATTKQQITAKEFEQRYRAFISKGAPHESVP